MIHSILVLASVVGSQIPAVDDRITLGTVDIGGRSVAMTIPSTGGLPEKLAPPYGANGAISPDGRTLAYTPHSRDHRTWKRYRGGREL